MHQSEDVDKKLVEVNPAKDMSRRSHNWAAEKSSSSRPNTFGGLKKGFILFGARKHQVDHDQGKTDVSQATGNDPPKVLPEMKGEFGYGGIEFQVFRGGDVDKEGDQVWMECTKYPGHEGFIPLPEFSTEKHLPERFHDEDFLDLIKSYADLTVRLRVKVSGRNPDDPFAKASAFTGTAFIGSAKSRDNDCFCRDCTAHGLTDRKWWNFTLTTATHCVDNEKEANNLRVDFFYDSEESVKNRDVKTIRGVRAMTASFADDLCALECATHDDDLGKRIHQRWQQTRQLIFKLYLKQESRPAASGKKVMLCISHPHGRPKQITVGEFVHEYDVTYEDPEQAQAVVEHTAETGIESKWFDYTTRTCPGSSGAELFCLDDLTSGEWRGTSSITCTHSGRSKREAGLNNGFGRRWGSAEKARAWLVRKGVTSEVKLNTWTQENWRGPGDAPWVDKKTDSKSNGKKDI